MANSSFVSLEELPTNEFEVFQEAVDILLRISNNILKDPTNHKFRQISLNSKVVQNKLLPANGALACLFEMGFVEGSTSLELPTTAPLTNVREIHSCLNNLKKESSKERLPQTTYPKPVEKALSKEFLTKYSNPFLRKVIEFAEDVLKYEDTKLQSKALKTIPLLELQLDVEKTIRRLQLASKEGKYNEADIDHQELLLYALLKWFKEEFFVWVDTPACDSCGNSNTKMKTTEIEKFNFESIRVEVYICSKCNKTIKFPRYNNPEKLLETRKGRCGEWANCFTLLCRALKWETRWVQDETDHVWTEVYLQLKKKWVHCDPCEMLMDCPLLYEAGWKKQISYVMAYSCDEVQDVTWRYSSNHSQVLTKRNLCLEQELSTLLTEIRDFRCRNYSKSRSEFIMKRCLWELCALMVERKPSESELNGRMSGSLQWRLARSEVENSTNGFSWKIDQTFLNSANTCAVIKYSPIVDKYYKGENEIPCISGWEKGLYEVMGIQRKVETDWKMVYLARNEQCELGKLVWKFEIDETLGSIQQINIFFEKTIFKSGNIETTISSGDLLIPLTENILETTKFSGCRSFTVTSSLSGGEGDIAWQHSQIFRQSLQASDYPFVIQIIFKPNV